jgi:hypothetical protein
MGVMLAPRLAPWRLQLNTYQASGSFNVIQPPKFQRNLFSPC